METQTLTEEDIQSLREQLAEQDYKASGEDYEHFIAGPIWEDMKANLQERIDGLLVKLESMENSPKADSIYKARLHEVRQLILYPEHVIELFNIIKEVPEDETTEQVA